MQVELNYRSLLNGLQIKPELSQSKIILFKEENNIKKWSCHYASRLYVHFVT